MSEYLTILNSYSYYASYNYVHILFAYYMCSSIRAFFNIGIIFKIINCVILAGCCNTIPCELLVCINMCKASMLKCFIDWRV